MTVNCPFCGSVDVVVLPVPHPTQSMISDGRIHNKPLNKQQCQTCWSICHTELQSAQQIAGIYDKNYSLPDLGPADDQRRAQNYGAALLEMARSAGLPSHPRVLDVGCGSGALVKWLSREIDGSVLVGTDPALVDQKSQSDVDLRRGTIEDLPENQRFDWSISVNTIEHIHDPAMFLQNIADRLNENGIATIVCPSLDPSNDELLFFDHLWTFSVAAMEQIASNAGLSLAAVELLTGPLSGFTAYLMQKTPCEPISLPTQKPDTAGFLLRWQQLEAAVLAELADKGHCNAFGAGQMAALFRAYAPQAFDKIDRFLVDDPTQSWPLGPIEQYRDSSGSTLPVLCLVHPRAQDAVIARMHRDGHQTIRLPV